MFMQPFLRQTRCYYLSSSIVTLDLVDAQENYSAVPQFVNSDACARHQPF